MKAVGDPITFREFYGAVVTGTVDRTQDERYIVHLDKDQAGALGDGYTTDCYITVHADEILPDRPWDVGDMTQLELESIIFVGAGVNEFRSPASAFTPDEIRTILQSPQFSQFDSRFRSWMYNAFEAACLDPSPTAPS